jgi:DNA-binding NtrC family response regulator
MTAHPRIESYIQAVHKLGAFEYIQKPLDLDILMVVIKRLLHSGETATS